jgi:hypothetical protein
MNNELEYEVINVPEDDYRVFAKSGSKWVCHDPQTGETNLVYSAPVKENKEIIIDYWIEYVKLILSHMKPSGGRHYTGLSTCIRPG